jgi:hypothetical protein
VYDICVHVLVALDLSCGYDILIFHVLVFIMMGMVSSRLQRLSGLRHELSSLAQTLGLWVRISLEAWMSVCIYSVFVLSCVQVAALQQADSPSKESYRLCKTIKKLKKWPRSNKGL